MADALDIRSHYGWDDTFHVHQTRIAARHWTSVGDFPLHGHDFMEIQVVVGGSVLYRWAGGSRLMHRGSVSIIRPGVQHAFDQCREFDAYMCCFGTGLLSRELAWSVDDPGLNPLLWNG